MTDWNIRIRSGDSSTYWAYVSRNNDIESLTANPDQMRMDDVNLSEEHKKKILKLRHVLKLSRKLKRNIQRLSNPERKTVHMYFFKQMTQVEIAMLLGVGRKSVRTQISKSVTKLREIMGGAI